MITKAIVEEIISPYQVRIRIPLFNRTVDSALATKTEELNIATICTLPNCYVNLQVGDVVFVGFEDNTTYRAVVLGHLSREAASSTCADLVLNSLIVNGSTQLSSSTSIGNVNSTELSCLQGVTDNIQRQLDSLKEQQRRLLKEVFKEEN